MTSERTQRRIDRLLDEAERALDDHDWPLAAERARDVLLLDERNQDAQNFWTAAQRAIEAAEAAHPRSPLPAGEGQGEGQPEQKRQARTSFARAGGSPALPAAGAEVPASFDNGRYVVSRFLGEGGKKRVYLAHDTLLDRDIAFALIKTEGLDEAGRDRIAREAQAMGRLGSHPHIVSVYDLGTEPATSNEQRAGGSLSLAQRAAEGAGLRAGAAPVRTEGQGEGESQAAANSRALGTPYIVTELMGGGDVEGLIEKAPDHRPPLERTLEIGIQVCRGLEFAHAHGIVHRDLKPGNVWLTAPTGSPQPATADPHSWRERVRVRANPERRATPGRPTTSPSPSWATSASPSRSTAPDSPRPA